MYRRRSKYQFKKRYTRRFKKYSTKFSTKRRILRKTLSRRPVKPEVKFVEKAVSDTGITSTSWTTESLSSSSLSQGADVNTRIGNSVRLRYVTARLRYQGGIMTPQTSIVFQRPTVSFRVLIWTPRVDFTLASAYVSAMGYLSTPDFNVLTVYRDFYINLAHANAQEVIASTGVISAYQTNGQSAYQKNMKVTIPFPRNAKFVPSTITGTNDFDVDKDVLYISHRIDNAPAAGVWGTSPYHPPQYAFTSKMTFTDN